MVVLSWYAVLALRRRVSMSAIGSVMVMRFQAAFSPRFPRSSCSRTCRRAGSGRIGLPAALGDARQLAAVRHLTHADAAEPELAVHRVRTTAPLAPGVAAHLELRRAGRLVDQCLLGHGSELLACGCAAGRDGHDAWKGKPSARRSA